MRLVCFTSPRGTEREFTSSSRVRLKERRSESSTGVFDYSKVIVRAPFKFVGVNMKLKFQPLIERMISLAKTKRKGGREIYGRICL